MKQAKPTNWNVVRALASEVRQWAEKIKKEEPKLGYDEGLGGLCARSSARLLTVLHKYNFDAVAYSNNCHVFVILDKHVVDVTATQFARQYDKVVIEKVQNCTQSWWRREFIHYDGRSLRTHQLRSGWPPWQTAFEEDYTL